jgi:hypothetical protein
MGKKKFLQISSSFSFSVWSIRTDLLLCPDMCGSDIQKVKWHVRMHTVLPSADMVVDVQTVKFCIRTHTLQVKDRILFSLPPHNLLFYPFLFCFLAILCWFLVLSHEFSSSFVFFCIFSPFHIFSSIFLYSFQFILTVRILGLSFWNIFWDK